MAPTGDVRERSVTDIEVRTRTTAYVSSERARPVCGTTVRRDPFPQGRGERGELRAGDQGRHRVPRRRVTSPRPTRARFFCQGRHERRGRRVERQRAELHAPVRQARGRRPASRSSTPSPPRLSSARTPRSPGRRGNALRLRLPRGDAAVYRASDAKGHAGVKGSPSRTRRTPPSSATTTPPTTATAGGTPNATAIYPGYLKGVAENEPGQACRGHGRLSSWRTKRPEGLRRRRGSLGPAIVAKFESCYRAMLESAWKGTWRAARPAGNTLRGIALARRMLTRRQAPALPARPVGSLREQRQREAPAKGEGEAQAVRRVPPDAQRRAALLGLPDYRGDGQDARSIQPYQAVHATFAGEGGLVRVGAGRRKRPSPHPGIVIEKGRPTSGLAC